MNETLKKLSDDTKAALISSIASKAVADLIAHTKSAGDNDAGSFKVVASTSDVDRQGESVNQAGWDLTFYKANPVVLWAHDYSQLPIGVCTSIEVKDGKLVAEGKFAPADANPFAQQVRKLYDLGMVNTTSVGFIPKEYDAEKSGLINKSELLEFSFVPVPANPYALRLNQIKELGIDTVMLKTKGIEVKEEPATTEKPAEATPTTEENKGVVADQLEVMKKQKYAMYRPVWDLMDAVCCIYFADATPAEDLGKILNEAADILKQIGSGSGMMEDEDMKKISDSIAKMLGSHKTVEHKDTLIALARNYIALGSLQLPEGGKSGKETNAATQRSKPSEALKEVNDFVGTRELLRIVDNAVGKALENFNIAARNRQ